MRLAANGEVAARSGLILFAASTRVEEVEQWVFAFLIACANALAFVGLLALITAEAAAGERGWARHPL